MEKWAKKSENHEIWANFDPHPRIFCGGSTQIFKTSFGYSFSGPIARKSLDHTPDSKGWKKFAPPQFFGRRVPHGAHKLTIMTQKFEVTVTLDPWARPVWILKFANFDSRNFFSGGGSPKNFKTSFGYSFSGPIAS